MDRCDNQQDQSDVREAPLNERLTGQETQKGLLDRFRYGPVRMPRTRAELFQSLAFYNPRIGWDAFVEMIDFSAVTPAHVYQVVLGRYPRSTEQALLRPGYDARQHFRDALISREFRDHFIGAFLQAYPAKGRDIFIHVPKCAGTDLILNLGSRLLPLPKMLEVDGWVDDSEFLEIVAGLARAAMTDARFFVYGHMELGKYVDIAGIRPDDRVFTVLRDPVDLMVSQANYVVGRLRQDPTGREPDAAGYLQMLGMTHLPENLSDSQLKDLTLRVLLNPDVTEQNRACFYLGSGSGAIYATALENLLIHNVEVTTTVNYDKWLWQRWGIAESMRHNRSEQILRNAEARRLCGTLLAASSQEDQKLYDLVSWALRETGGASITGQQLARLVGPPLADALRANARPPLPSASAEIDPEQNILLAQGVKDVELYLAAVSAVGPGCARMDPVVEAGFGANEAGEQYRLQGWRLQGWRLQGWARPEASFTWTAAEECTIQLPHPQADGRFIVRFVASPFISKPRLPFQQVNLLVNGVRLGACQVKDLSVIEAEIPPELLDLRQPLTVTLRLPTATRPNAVSDSADDRLLALAVRGMTLFRLVPAG